MCALHLVERMSGSHTLTTLNIVFIVKYYLEVRNAKTGYCNFLIFWPTKAKIVVWILSNINIFTW